MRLDQRYIERALAPIVGKRLRAATATQHLQAFSFGEERTIPTRFPRPGQPTQKRVAEYVLHVHCAWRLVDAGGARVESLPDSTFVVERIVGDDFGGVRLELSEQFALELIPDPSHAGEYWRLLRPGINQPHVAVSRNGIAAD